MGSSGLSPVASLARRIIVMVAATAVAACGGNPTGSTPPPPPPPPPGTISLSLGSQSASVDVGGTVTINVSITRGGGFTGTVSLAVSGLPAGVTGSFAPSSLDPNTTASVLTLTAGSNAAAATTSITVTASGSGVTSQSGTVQLTIVPPAGPIGFNVTVDPVEFELPAGRGWSANGVVSIQRINGFTGSVTVSVQGMNFPAAVAPTPTTIGANQTASNLIGLAVDNGAPGLYTGTLKVSAPGFADRTAPVRLRVSMPSTGNITWNFCRADRVPKYFAIRDGNGAWQHVVPDGPAAASAADPAKFSFSVTQSTASIVLVWLGEKTSASPLIEGHHWNVLHLSRQEVIDLAAGECVANRDITTRQATAPVTGYQSFDAIVAATSRSGLAAVGSTGPLNTTLTMLNLPPGAFDLLLTRSNFNTGPGPDITVQSVVLRRGVDPAAGGTLPGVNFASEGFAPAAATLTFGNTGGEAFNNVMTFRTADGLNGLMAAPGGFPATSRVWFGVPNGRLAAGDLHQVVATTTSTTARRQLIHFARDVAARTLDFGPALASPTVTPGGSASPWLLRATGTLGADYLSRVSIYYRENFADPRTMTVVASGAFLGAGQYDLSIPDLGGVPGFTSFWHFRKGSPVRWTVTGGQGATGDVLTDTFCTLVGICPVAPVDGTTYKSAQATGTVTVP